MQNIHLKVAPIKEQLIPLGNVRAGAPATVGSGIIRFSTPSRRIHWMLQIGWVGNPAFTLNAWSLYPLMVDPVNGSRTVRLAPVVSAQVLPDGYEAESGVKLWEATYDLTSDDTVDGQIFAVMTWEPAMVDMCEEERAYWAARCTAVRINPLLDIGGSL